MKEFIAQLLGYTDRRVMELRREFRQLEDSHRQLEKDFEDFADAVTEDLERLTEQMEDLKADLQELKALGERAALPLEAYYYPLEDTAVFKMVQTDPASVLASLKP